MNQFEILKYYSRPDIQKAMISVAKDREVVGSVKDGSFLKRPDTLLYPKDIVERAKKGVVAFHCSVEKWSNPMQLHTGLNPKELDRLRKGFDFILDIDAKAKLEHSIAATKVIYNYLKDLGIKVTIKFSGRRGFHIGIASNAFPDAVDYKKISSRYPEIPQTITEFIREKIRDQILEEMISIEGGVAALAKTIPSISKLTPYDYVDVTRHATYLPKYGNKIVYLSTELEKGWGSRHLFRIPYSLHPAQWLVSMPIRAGDLKNFKIKDAKPDKIKTDVEFLVNKNGEATEFLVQVLDWKAKQPREEIRPKRIRLRMKTPIPEDFFPPCIKLMLNGLPDGKKRSLFTLSTFLRSMNWKPEDIQKKVEEWNQKNPKPLSKRQVSTQLKWHLRQKRELIPANCMSNLFYGSIGICQPDRICDFKKIKNPVNYPFKAMKRNKRIKK